MKEHALSLARKGFRVFPVGRASKLPVFPQYFQRATTSEDTITAWWTARYRNCNIGISLPGVLVIDIDGDTGEANFQRLAQHKPFPPTATAISGSGKGRHLFYRLPAGRRATPHTLDSVDGYETYDKIDVKGSGGFVVGAGSRHKSGGTYQWVNEPESIGSLTPAPQWMLDDLCEAEDPKYLIETPTLAGEFAAPGSSEELLPYLLQKYPVLPQDRSNSHHNRTSEAAAWLWGRGYPRERVESLLEQWLTAGGRDDNLAFTTMRAILDYNFVKLETGDPSVYIMTDHQQLTADSFRENQKRGRAQKAFCALPQELGFSEAEQRFLQALEAHVSYELAKPDSDQAAVLMTHRQLMRVYELLHPGHKLNWKPLGELLNKFVTRGNKRATKLEVLAMVRAGKVREASVYESRFFVSEAVQQKGVSDEACTHSDGAGVVQLAAPDGAGRDGDTVLGESVAASGGLACRSIAGESVEREAMGGVTGDTVGSDGGGDDESGSQACDDGIADDTLLDPHFEDLLARCE